MAEWVLIDTEVLRSARDSRGLSYETMARQLHVSSKTWERYEKAGRVPRPLLAQVADILDLEIEEPAPRKVVIESAEVRIEAIDELKRYLDERLDELAQSVQAIDRKLDLIPGSDERRELERLLGRLSVQLDQV